MDAVVQVNGYVGNEVEIKGGGTVSKFRLATTPRVKTKGEWTDGTTTWIDVTCFRALAEHVSASLRKGDAVVVVGKLRTSAWESDGQTRTRMEIIAEIVGHDLNKGTAMFRKHTRPDSEEEPPEDETSLAGLSVEERAAQAA